MKIFDIDSPFMRALTKIADLMILNVTTILFCIPSLFVSYAILMVYLDEGTISLFVVLIAALLSCPVGAALTGMHYVLLKMVRDEESYIIKSFWKSFRENFKQATALWYIVLFVAFIIIGDFWFLTHAAVNMPLIYRYLLLAITVALFVFGQYIFPLQSKFVNPVRKTLKNSILMSILALPRSLAMLAISIMVLVLIYFFEGQMIPIMLIIGLSGPGYLKALLYNSVFKRFEPEDDAAGLTEEEELNRAIQRMDETDETNSNEQ